MTDKELRDKFAPKLKSLVFGDAEQLTALREWRAEIDRNEERERRRNELKTFRVAFAIIEEQTDTVEALDQDDAEEIIYNRYTGDEIEILSVTEVKSKK